MAPVAAIQDFPSERVCAHGGPRTSGPLRSLADDPHFLAELDDLDSGVFGFFEETGTMIHRRPLMAQLVVPGSPGVPPARRPVGIISAWTASWIILATLTGASAAGWAFHATLSEILVAWESTTGAAPSVLSSLIQ